MNRRGDIGVRGGPIVKFVLAFAFTRHGADFCPQQSDYIDLWITLSITAS